MNMKIPPWVGIALVVVGFGAHAQGIHKCVGKDGKTSYSSAPCPGSKEIEVRPPPPAVKGSDAKKESSARPLAPGTVAFPEMQTGQWKLRVVSKGRTRDSEICGNPIDSFGREVQEYATTTKWGCSMTSTNPSGPRSVRVVYDCPSDRSPDGRPVEKGRSEISLVSASPQAFRLEMKSTVNGDFLMEGTRIGDCK